MGTGGGRGLGSGERALVCGKGRGSVLVDRAGRGSLKMETSKGLKVLTVYHFGKDQVFKLKGMARS